MRYIFLLLLSNYSFAGNVKAEEYCPALRECLNLTSPACQLKQYPKLEDIEYDTDFCEPIKELQRRGASHTERQGKEMYTLMSKEYRILYPVKGKLPISANTMKFLLGNLPFTTHIINAYQKTKYWAAYTNSSKTTFNGNNGGSLKGKFAWADRSTDQQTNLVYGTGYAKVLMWNLKGDAIVTLDYQPLGKDSITYDIVCYAFPSGSILNGIMEMSMFRNVVLDKINEIIQDIQSSAHRFAAGEREPIKNYAKLKTSQYRFYLKEFEETLKGIPPSE
jgi:hypothetical protein